MSAIRTPSAHMMQEVDRNILTSRELNDLGESISSRYLTFKIAAMKEDKCIGGRLKLSAADRNQERGIP